MIKTLEIGRTVEGERPFNLPEDAATQTFAFIARKGAGKTYAAGKLVEQLVAHGTQVCILDSVGNWWGLRIAADGKGAGIDIPVIGGLRGDIPLEATGGELIADILVESGRSLILDVSQFSKADRQRFATAFGTRLWRNKKAQRSPSPIHLVIEESQLIVPEQGRGDTAAMVGIYEEIIRLGRNYGIGVTMISQRPQSVNKEVLNQTECLFVLQVNGAHERKALREWIVHAGLDVKLLDELPGLPIGVAYVWSPQWLRVLAKVQIGEKRTFDSSATPRAGHKSKRAGEIKPLDLADLQTKMAETIERKKADDPRELRRQISELRAQLAKAGQAKLVKEIQYVEIVPDTVKSWFERLASSTENLSKTFAQEAVAMRAYLKALLTNRNGPRATREPLAIAPITATPQTNPSDKPLRHAAPVQKKAGELELSTKQSNFSNDPSDLGKGERTILSIYVSCILRRFFRVAVLSRDGGIGAAFFGLPGDVEVALYVSAYLIRTYERLWKQFRQTHETRPGRDQRAFYHGLTDGLDERLTRARVQAAKSEQNALIRLDTRLHGALESRGIKRTSKELLPHPRSVSAFVAGYREGTRLEIRHGMTQRPARQLDLGEARA